jgi:hypothetical protein
MAMLKYVGPYDVVEVPLNGVDYVTVERDGVAEFEDTFAASLLEQPGNWQDAGNGKIAAKPAKATPPADTTTQDASTPGATATPDSTGKETK